ncbi:MAG: acyltransferase family protein [Rhodobacterales bacterium]|nr:acyltransferase family protein [Rhodobacterales bacterium]
MYTPPFSPPNTSSPRIPMLDVARFYGIVLVYYGHVVERMMYLGAPGAALQYKFIYSFHMPLFFVLSGFIAAEGWRALGPGAFAKSRLASRVLPYLVFNLLLILISLVHRPDFPPFPLDSLKAYEIAGISTLIDLPFFNVPTWFLMCLISVEVAHYLLFRFLYRSDLAILAAAVGLIAFGSWLNGAHDFFTPTRFAKWNWWFLNLVPTGYGFYLLGVLGRRRGFLMGRVAPSTLLQGALVAILFVALTFNLNMGPFKLKIPAVVFVAGGFGHWFWFPATAIVGSAGLLLMARLSPPWGWMTFMGRNALILFCLNGVVYHHVNGPVAAWTVATFGPGTPGVTAVAALTTAASLALAVPVVRALNRWVPQLVGRPREKGPLLPNLL